MPIKARHSIRFVAALQEVDMSEFTSVIVYHNGLGDLEASPNGTQWFTVGTYTVPGAGNFATAFTAHTLMRGTANIVAIEGIREVS